jgi:hypothetical protein
MNTPNSSDIQAAIAQARGLVNKARKTLIDAEQFFAEQGLDEETCLRELRRLGGEEAVTKAKAEVEATLRAVEEEVQRNKVAGKAKPIARRVAIRGNRI